MAVSAGGDKEGIAVIGAVGDIMPGDSFYCVGHGIRSRLLKQGMDFVFHQVAELLMGTHCTVANLESVVSDMGLKKNSLPSRSYRGPGGFAQVLAQHNIGIVSVANNHMLEHGPEAVQDTLEKLQKAGVKALGLPYGRQSECPDKQIASFGGVRIAFLSYCLNLEKSTVGIVPGEAEILADVRFYRDQVDRVMLCLHWGVEYMPFPSPAQVQLAHRLIEAGVDIILGHHPHCLQGIETYQDGIIAYSLGNFVCDSWHNTWRESLFLKLSVPREGAISYETTPIWINDEYQPCIQDGLKAELARRKFNALCRIIGTQKTILSGDMEEYSRIALRITDVRRKQQHKVVFRMLPKLSWLMAAQILLKPVLGRLRRIL